MHKKVRTRTKPTANRGFTIVELMIALSVLSVLLITVTMILIQIGALYSKGVNAANLQTINRNIVADLSSQLQFSGTAPVGCTPQANPPTCYADSVNDTGSIDGGGSWAATVYSYCIGSTRYSYVLNHELGTDSSNNQITRHVLWRDTLSPTATGCPALKILSQDAPTDASSQGDGYEVLSNHMRLTRFDIEPTSSSSGIYNIDVWMAFGDSDLVQTAANGLASCRGGSGTQFCVPSNISTQVIGRVF